MLAKDFQFTAYSELDNGMVRETIKKELEHILSSMPPSTNDHAKVSLDYRLDRIMECIGILSNPNSTSEEKLRARRKKYKLLHPDRIWAEQNSRRRKQYASDPEYRRKEIEREKHQREINPKYLEQKHRTSAEVEYRKRSNLIYRLGGRCVICGCNANKSLEFHHTDPNEKEYNISDILYDIHKEIRDTELTKCVLLCNDCHARITLFLKYLRLCKDKNLSFTFFLEVIEEYKAGSTIIDICRKRDLPDYTVRSIIYDRNYFRPIFELIKRELRLLPYDVNIAQNMSIQDKLINLNTPYQLELIRQMQNFNQEPGNQYFYPIPPPRYAEGALPFDMDGECLVEGELDSYYVFPSFATPHDMEYSLAAGQDPFEDLDLTQ
jgi:hypothetical protein